MFTTALDLARKNREVRVLMQDPGQRRLQFAEGDRTATLNVVPFSDDVSQLLIAGHAGPGEGSTVVARRAGRPAHLQGDEQALRSRRLTSQANPRKRSAVRQRTPSASAGGSGARCSSSSVTAPG